MNYRQTYLLPQLIERAATADPDHVALRYRGQSLNYGALYAQAASLSRALIADGVSPGDRIGILLPKSLESAIALYGIMGAGAVYVPLDPTAPSSRVEFVVRDCGIRRIVSSGAKKSTITDLSASGVELDAVFGVGDLHDLGTGHAETVDKGDAPAPPLGQGAAPA